MLSNEVEGEGYWGRWLRLKVKLSVIFKSTLSSSNLSKNVDVCNGDAANGKEARLGFGTDIKLKIGHLGALY